MSIRHITKLPSSIKETLWEEDKNDLNMLDETIQEKWNIELRRGTAKVFKEDKNNAISTTRTNGIFLIPYALLTNFKKYGNLFFLIISIIMISAPDLTPYFRWITAFPLFIYTIIHVVKVFHIYFLRRREDKRINLLTTRRAKKGTGEIEENILWKTLKPGDIIYLKKEEICPADIILLDTSLPKNRDSICWIDTQDIDGFSTSIMKKTANSTKVDRGSTRKGDYSEYRKILSGKIEYDPPSSHVKGFSGYIKLKKDPRAESLSEDNFVPRGSVIKNTDWVYGLCVYTGNDTRIMHYPRRSTNKGSYFDRLAEKFFLSGIAIIFLFSIISIGIFKGQNDDYVLNLEYPNGLRGSNFILYIILYSPLLPIAFYATSELILVNKVHNMHRRNKVQDNRDNYIKILDPSALPNLGHVDYCLVDKTGTLTTSKYKIKSIFTNSKLYNINAELLKGKKKGFTRTLSFPFGNNADNKPEAGLKGQDISRPTFLEVADEPHQIAPSPDKLYKFIDTIEDKFILETERNETEQDLIKNSQLDKSESKKLLNMLKVATEGDENEKGAIIYLNTEENDLTPIISNKKISKEIEIPSNEKGNSPDIIIPKGEESRLLSPTTQKDGSSPVTKRNFTPNSVGRTIDSFGDFLEKNYNEDDYFEDCNLADDSDMQQFVKALALCHSVRSKYTEKEYIYESPYSEELPLVELGSLSGKSFIISNRPDNPSKYTVQENGAYIDYKILGVNDFSYSRNKFSIVAKLNDETSAFIYAKGSANAMRTSLQLDSYEMAIYDSFINNLQSQGYKIVVLAGRELESEEEENFYKKYQNYKMSLYSQEIELNALAKEVEKGLKFIGIVALQDELRPEATEMIHSFHSAGIKTWMVTGDHEDNAINVSYLTKLIKKEADLHAIKFDNVEDGRAVIRNTLTNLKKHFKSDQGKNTSENLNDIAYKFEYKDDVVLTVNGETLDVIWKDAYLKTNFAFLCKLCNSVVAFELNPTHKKMLTLLVKQNLPKSSTVMAIGDGHNDKLMLQTADISFELKPRKEAITIQAGDIQINSLSQIHQLLLVDGRDISEKIERSLHFTFYKSLTFTIPIFFSNVFNSSAGVPLFDSMLVFLFSFLFTFFAPLLYGAFDKSEPKEILLAFPALYIDAQNKKRRSWINFCIQSLLGGILHGVLIYFIIAYSVQYGYSKDGLTSNLTMNSLAQYYAIAVLVHIQFYGYFKARKFVWTLATVISLVSILVYLFVNDAAQFVDSDYLNDTKAIFRRAGPLLSMIFVIVFGGTITYLLRKLLKGKIYQTWYSIFAQKVANSKIQKLTNENILSVAKKPEELGSIVKGIYKQIELLDPIVQQMINPADRSLNELDIKRFTLEFGDMRLERKYKMIMSKLIAKNFRIIYFAILIAFGGYILGTSLLVEEDVYSLSRLGVFLGFLVLGAVLFVKPYQAFYYELTFIFILLVCTVKVVFDWTRTTDSSLGAALIASCIAIVFNTYAFWLFLINIAYYIVYLIRIIVLYTLDFESNTLITFYILWSLIVLIGAITITISARSYQFEKQQRSEFIANAKLEVHLDKTNDILSILLPRFIKEKISRLGNDKTLAEDQGEVAILFCDIMDFDKIIQHEGKNLVQILDKIFRAFDQLCGTQGVQKIETVGKTYMGCAGLKSCEIGISKDILAMHPTRRILHLALNMEEFVKKVTYGNGIPLKLRIGLHYGRVIAGVIGYHKPQFSLIGDAVNTTSRVCTANNPGQIRMSDEAYNKMMEAGGAGHNELYFIPKTEEMKGKGEVKIHIVARKSTNTGFKKMIGNALKINKTKGVYAIQPEKVEKDDLFRRPTTHNAFENIKENLLTQREKIKVMLTIKSNDQEENQTHNGLEGKETKDMKELLDDFDDDDDQDVPLFKYNPFTLRLNTTSNKYKRGEFEDQINKHNREFSLGTNVCLIIVHFIQTGILIALQDNYPLEFTKVGAIISLRIIFVVALFLILIFDKKLTNIRRKGTAGFTVFIFGLIVSIIQASFTERETYQIIQVIELMLVYSVGIHAGGFDFVFSLIFAACSVAIFFISFGVEGKLNISNVFYFWIFLIANLIQKYIHIKDELRFYKNIRLREKRKIEQSGLVGQLLPLHAAEIYFGDPTGRVDVSDEFKNVTILYADIKGFTDYSAGVEPKDVVTMLSALFTRFDKVCVQYSLYKVYTIGDCYVALSFFDASKRNPGKEAYNMVNMALSMIDIIREVRKEVNFDGLDMRIGLHTGSIIGGVVGTDIIRYDIWGRDVLIANAMESEGVKGNINVSESTKELLEMTNPGLYRFEPHKTVNMEKIQAQIPCYLLYANDNLHE